MSSSPSLNVQAVVNLLGRLQPQKLHELELRYPDQKAVLSPGKILGDHTPPRPLLMDLAIESFSLAKDQGKLISETLRRRIRASARLRMIGSILASLCSAGIVAAVLHGHSASALAAASIAFVSTVITMVAQYIDDFAASG